VQQKLKTSLTHVTTWWGLTWRRRLEEDMEQDWKHGRSNNFRCTEADIVAGKRLTRFWLR
jgi:hypothetical protein